MIKAVIFDCFGVIVTDALQAMVDKLRLIDSMAADQIERLVADGSRGNVSGDKVRQIIADKFGLSLGEYADQIKNNEVRNWPLIDYIKSLRADFKTDLLSNINRGGLEVRFTSDELKSWFDVVAASSDLGFAKPEARAYEIVAERLGVRLDECVMIDDRQDYCQGAKAVGMQAVQYQSFEQMKHELSRLIASTI